MDYGNSVHNCCYIRSVWLFKISQLEFYKHHSWWWYCRLYSECGSGQNNSGLYCNCHLLIHCLIIYEQLQCPGVITQANLGYRSGIFCSCLSEVLSSICKGMRGWCMLGCQTLGVLLEMWLLQLSLDSKDEIAKEGNLSQHFVIHVFSKEGNVVSILWYMCFLLVSWNCYKYCTFDPLLISYVKVNLRNCIRQTCNF